jgi:glycosyltransferase involved in cell wall biosynthesis
MRIAQFPFVSVIVATKNRKRMLGQLLESIDRQTYPRDRFELILVDDGSTDGAWEWVREAKPHFNFQLRIFQNDKPTGGPAAPRNLGIRQAQGEIIAITDSDCVVAPEWLAEAVSQFEAGIGLVQGKTIPHPDDPRKMFSTTNIISTVNGDSCNIFYTRAAIDRAGYFSCEFLGGNSRFSMYGDDVDMAYRVKEAGYTAIFAEKALVMHHIVPLTFWEWLLRPRSAITGPFLVRRHPRIREELLFLRYFVNRMTASFDLLVLGAVLASFWTPWWLLLGMPFLVGKYREGDSLNPAKQVLRVFGGLLRSSVTFGALVYGSIRARTVLL